MRGAQRDAGAPLRALERRDQMRIEVVRPDQMVFDEETGE
jgi:hypothetical protein